MNCNAARNQLQEYLDSALPESEARKVRRHLDSCAECRKELDLLGRVDLTLRTEAHQELPRDLAAAVLQRLGRRFNYGWRDVVAVAASVAIVLGLAWLLGPILESALLNGQSETALPPMADIFRIDVSGFSFSYDDFRDLVMEGHMPATGAAAETAGWFSLGGPVAAILLVVSALLAIGTNALCYRRAYMNRLREI
ncbi:MAG: zf-HC2 domain-containing protein [Planctomycetota bacterium]